MKEFAVCFTGHRDIPKNDEETIKSAVRSAIYELAEEGYTDFYAGGASGFDMIASLEVIELKKVNKNIKLKLILPYKRDVKTYNLTERYKQKQILDMADSVEYVFERYLPWCFHTRNRRLVDLSSVCVAYLVRPSGGTYYTVNYAEESRLRIIKI